MFGTTYEKNPLAEKYSLHKPKTQRLNGVSQYFWCYSGQKILDITVSADGKKLKVSSVMSSSARKEKVALKDVEAFAERLVEGQKRASFPFRNVEDIFCDIHLKKMQYPISWTGRVGRAYLGTDSKFHIASPGDSIYPLNDFSIDQTFPIPQRIVCEDVLTLRNIYHANRKEAERLELERCDISARKLKIEGCRAKLGPKLDIGSLSISASSVTMELPDELERLQMSGSVLHLSCVKEHILIHESVNIYDMTFSNPQDKATFAASITADIVSFKNMNPRSYADTSVHARKFYPHTEGASYIIENARGNMKELIDQDRQEHCAVRSPLELPQARPGP